MSRSFPSTAVDVCLNHFRVASNGALAGSIDIADDGVRLEFRDVYYRDAESGGALGERLDLRSRPAAVLAVERDG